MALLVNLVYCSWLTWNIWLPQKHIFKHPDGTQKVKERTHHEPSPPIKHKLSIGIG